MDGTGWLPVESSGLAQKVWQGERMTNASSCLQFNHQGALEQGT